MVKKRVREKEEKHYIEVKTINWEHFWLLFFFGWFLGLVYLVISLIPILNYFLLRIYDEINYDSYKFYYRIKKIPIRKAGRNRWVEE